MSDEQRVRTMAGWIGVEISKSRARKVDNPEYGLYRVRESKKRDFLQVGEAKILDGTEVPEIRNFVPTEWTAYAFTLEEIDAHVALAIQAGTPARPGAMNMYDRARPGTTWMVPTRWTQAYRGRRNLGVVEPVSLKPTTTATGKPLSGSVRARQRADNMAFQAEHAERRDYGLAQRHAAKLRHNREQLGEG